MIAGIEQTDRFMLAVHLDQHSAHFAHHRHAGRLIVDERARASVGGKLAAQHQRF